MIGRTSSNPLSFVARFAQFVDVQERFTARRAMICAVQEDVIVLNVVSIEGKAFNPGARGYYAAYRPHEVNRCPGCGRSHWLVGRALAECAFCSTALPLLDGGMNGVGLFRRGYRAGEDGTSLAA